MLRVAGGLISISHSIYPLVGGKFNSAISEWKFEPSGATISFRHLQNSNTHYDYQGAQFTFIGFDEVGHIDKDAVLYLFSRNRSVSSFRPWIRMTCNPDANHFTAQMVDWWIDEAGYPIPDRSGIIRYFINHEENFVFADTEEELRERYPDCIPKSFTFIPSKLDDNPKLTEADPGYRANLMMLHQIERERLLNSNWKIKPDVGKVFNKSWFRIVPAPRKYVAKVRAFDMAATAKSLNENAFYTAGVLVGLCDDDTYDVIDAIAEQVSPTESDKLMIRTAKRDGKDTFIAWEEEPGSSGKRVTVYLKELLKGYFGEEMKLSGDKLTKARPTATDAEHGKINLVEGSWNDRFLSAIHMFDGTPKILTNDLTDALSLAHAFLRDPEKLSARQYARFLRGEI
jgi:predicted phage terminase large subunit-like protein